MTHPAFAAIWAITLFDVSLGTRIMLGIELLAVALLLVGIVSIAFQVGSTTGLSAAPFQLGDGISASGVGAGMVAAVLSFGGFEGAASLGEESRNPRRYIPIAILSTVIFAGILYTFVSIVEVNAYGVTPEGLAALQGSGSSVVELFGRYLGPAFTALITLFISFSGFATALGSATASSRGLYQLGVDGKVPAIFSHTHPTHQTPNVANNVISAIAAVVVLAVWLASGTAIDGFLVFQYLGTIGTISLIVLYLLTCVSAVAYFAVRRHEWTWQAIFPTLGALILLYVLWANVAPGLEYPFNLFPYVALALLVAGYVTSRVVLSRRGEGQAARAAATLARG